MADSAAAKMVFQGRETDIILSDCLWVARQSAAGHDYISFPIDKLLPVLLSKRNSVEALRDPEVKKIEFAGGLLDNSWLVLQASTQQKYGIALQAQKQQDFGIPP